MFQSILPQSLSLQYISGIVLRALISYILLLIVARFVGRKVISQITFFDFAVAITLGTLGATAAMGKEISSVSAVIVMIVFALLAVLTGFLHIKSRGFRRFVGAEPVELVRNGEIVKENLKRTRTTLDTLNAQLREKNAFNLADVEFAVMEADGKLSVLPKSQKQPVTPSDLNVITPYKGLAKDIIIDGHIMHENLKSANKDERWLLEQLRSKGIDDAKEVFFAALDTSGNLYISKGLK